MGTAATIGLCLVLSALPPPEFGAPAQPICVNDTHCVCPPGYEPPPGYELSPGGAFFDSCDDINECRGERPPCGPAQSCNNTAGGFSCYCNPGYRPAPPPPAPPAAPTPTPRPLLNCVDVDECEEGGEGQCEGGTVCFNTPGSFECHCPPGGGCAAVTEPPRNCSDDESDCELEKTLTPIYEMLRGGRDPHRILKELLAVLDAALGAAGEGDAADVPKRHRRATAVLAATEGLLRGVGALLPPATVTAVTSNGTELRMTVHRGPPPGPLRLRVPGVELDVPREVAEDSDSSLALVALLSQRALGRVLEGAPKVRGGDVPPPPPPGGGHPPYRLLSPVATAIVTRPRPPGPPEVTLRFQHPPPDPDLGGRVLCAFWHPRERLWATGGCREVTPPRPGGTTCACNHLTSFAVLLAFHELPDSLVLDVVTKVGLGVSVLCLVLAAATFLLCRALKGLRTTLHLHLSLSLLLAHSTFLLGIDRPQDSPGCAVVAGLLHFSFLAAFCWMGLEGLHLHLLLVRVFPPSWLRVRHLLLVGYGVPALVVTIAAAVFPAGYGTPRYCWLSLDRGFRWSFQGPVCLIIALNAVTLVVTVWKLVQKFNDINPDMGHLRKMRVLAATATGQLCLLGTGWALGLGLGGGLPRAGGGLAPLPLLFCALNTAQGLFIFLCHCLAHPKVREAYRACLCPGTKPYSEFTSNSSHTRQSRLQTYT